MDINYFVCFNAIWIPERETALIIASGYCCCEEKPFFEYKDGNKVKFKIPDNATPIKGVEYFTCCIDMSSHMRSYIVDINGSDETQVLLCDLNVSDEKNEAGIWRLGKKF